MSVDDLHPSDTPALSREDKLTLEGPFINADDAAFWAHQRIDKRDAEYGGAILQKAGRFYASLPVMADAGGFAPNDVVEIGDDGQLILPSGYSCYAFYHSHPADDEKFKGSRLTEDQRAIVRGLFSFYDIDIIVELRHLAPAHYLSGPDGSLIKYVTSGTAREREFLLRISPAQRATLNVFDDYIPLMAEAGELWVIVANRAWGGVRGRVAKDWMPGTRLSAVGMQPLFGKVTSAPNVQHLLPVAPGVMFGYQLKAIGKDEYIVPAPAWESSTLTSPSQLFPQRTDGGVRLPSNFRISTLYCRPAVTATWQHANFFTPALLAAGAQQLRTAPELYDREQRLRLVMRSADGALLAYRLSGTDGEANLLGMAGASAEAQLRARTLTPRQFVERLAAIGELDVLQAGTDWIETGRFKPAAQPFEQLKNSMSPAFVSADDAARYLHARISSRVEDQLGLIVQRDDGRFSSTAPLRESELSAQMGLSYDGAVAVNLVMPQGYRIVGFFVALAENIEWVKHDLAKRKGIDSGLSLNDEALLYSAVPNYGYTVSITAARQPIAALYYSSPFDSLVKYVRSGSEAERNFSSFMQEGMRRSEIKRQLDGFDGSWPEMVRKLVRLGEFLVLETSPVWGGSYGKIAGAWTPFKPFTAGAPVMPALSWVFESADSAAEYGLDQQPASGGQLSFILKVQQAEAYVVTRPVALQPGLPVFSQRHVFDGLPAGYELYGVCHAPRPPLGLKIAQHWLYESFISPAELAAAIAQSREPDDPLRALFMHTRDGARLKYTFSGSALESQLYGIAPMGVVTDNGRLAALIANQLTPQQFVGEVAAAGRLAVLQAGSMWDIEGTVDAHWKPFFRYPTLTLSPRLLSADDAARFAHEQVGSQRDAQYCGVILQTAEQRYVATLPWPCRGEQRFTLSAIFPADHTGTLIVPRGFTLHGQYASCTALALLDRARMQRYGWSRNEAYVDWQLFTDEDLRSIIDNRHQVSVAYLSCAEDALLGYDLSGSAAELTLLGQLAPGAGGSALEQRRRTGAVRPENMVNLLAAVGLRIVQGSRLWGSSGPVAPHWRAFATVLAHAAPEQVAFGAVFASAEAAASDAHARVARGYGSTQTCFAFVLKHGQKDEYVVSQAVPSDQDSALFSLASLFSTDDDGAYVYPPGFALYGLFYARQWMPQGLSRDQLWLAGHFISSVDLYGAFQAARRWRQGGSESSLPVFISTLDNALLRYQAPVSTGLFGAVKHPSGQFEDVHTRLASGQLTAQGFVIQVLTTSDLSVVVANECWDETGKLGVDWLPYADFSRRALSPAFFSQADAVRYAQARLAPQREEVFGGLILKRLDGLFVATDPLPVPTENFDPKWILPDEDVRADWLAPGMTLVGRYRSRADTQPAFLLDDGELEVYRGMFSTDVLAKAFTCNHLWSHEYLLGLDGALIGFSCNGPDDDLLGASQKNQAARDRQQLQQALAPASRTPHDPLSNLIELQLREGRKTPTEFVNQVLKAASMEVVQGSELWGAEQQLPRGWQTAHGYIPAQNSPFASADRAFSSVFSHIDDVGRHIHTLAGNRSELTYGFIVKAGNGHWMASLPVISDGLQFPQSRVWLRGQLPPGCTVQGLYVHAPAQQPEELGASPIYRAFVNPSLLNGALNTVRKNGGSFLPLYLSCADGALLKYRAAFHDRDWDRQHRLQAYVEKLNGPFNPAEYIRQVARAGTLEVLVSGEIWASLGPVSQHWTAREVIAYSQGANERVALGPIFSHADDAARYHWRRLRHDSSKTWMAAILGNGTAPSSTFLVTDPVSDDGPIVDVGVRPSAAAWRRLFEGVMNLREPKPSPKYPAGYHVVGVQQIYRIERVRQALADRHEEAMAANFIPNKVFRAVIEMLRTDHVAGARYYATPSNGALLVYLPSYLESESKLLREDWSYHFSGTPSQVITRLANTGKLYILEPDSFWQPRGHVGTRLLMQLRRP